MLQYIHILVVTCPRIYNTPYLMTSCPDGYAWGSECTFRCEDGYDLSGWSSTACEAPGNPPLATWRHGLQMPICEGMFAKNETCYNYD